MIKVSCGSCGANMQIKNEKLNFVDCFHCGSQWQISRGVSGEYILQMIGGKLDRIEGKIDQLKDRPDVTVISSSHRGPRKAVCTDQQFCSDLKVCWGCLWPTLLYFFALIFLLGILPQMIWL